MATTWPILGAFGKILIGTDVGIDLAQRIQRIVDGFKKQGDWDRNTGRRVRYSSDRYDWRSLSEAGSLAGTVGGGIEDSKLYQGNTNITRWLNK